MERINATHFIEQYNAKPCWRDNSYICECAFTNPLLIESLSKVLDDTKKTTSLHTVAVFKIKFKAQ